LKLSAILEPLVAAGVDAQTILATVKAWELQQTDALERRRANDRDRQERRRHVKSRDVTVTVSSHARADPLPSTSLPSGKQEEKKASPSAQRRGERIPDDFEPDVEAAISEGLSRPDAEREARTFVDYWRARPGREALKLDWPATWRVWFRKRLETPQTQRANAPPGKRRGFADVAMDRMNGHGTASIFGDSGDAQRASEGRGQQPRSDDGHIRGGLAGRIVTINH
jgi:hypothetical protein